MLAGNEVPQYTDNSGSIVRRLAVFKFDNKVTKSDSTLKYKIKKELAWIMQACNKGYLDAVRIYPSRGIWDILPNYFQDTKAQIASDTNALTHFLKSEMVVFGKDLYCREKIFVEVLNAHAKDHHFTATKWTNQFYSGPFSDNGIKILKNARRRYPNKPNEKSYTGCFILGVDLRVDAPHIEGDETDSVLEFNDS